MGVCLHVCMCSTGLWCLQKSKGILDPLELEFHMVLSHPVGAVSWTQVQVLLITDPTLVSDFIFAILGTDHKALSVLGKGLTTESQALFNSHLETGSYLSGLPLDPQDSPGYPWTHSIAQAGWVCHLLSQPPGNSCSRPVPLSLSSTPFPALSFLSPLVPVNVNRSDRVQIAFHSADGVIEIL